VRTQIVCQGTASTVAASAQNHYGYTRCVKSQNVVILSEAKDLSANVCSYSRQEDMSEPAVSSKAWPFFRNVFGR
jgi:hypothetical protein